MYQERLEEIAPGARLARTIHDEAGRVLLSEGTVLSPVYVTALRTRGYSAVWVQDGLADDIRPDNLVTAQVRASACGTLSAVFDAAGQLGGRLSGEGPRSRSVDDAVHRLGPGAVTEPVLLDGLGELYRVTEQIMGEISDGAALATLDSLKAHSTYTFEHSVDVAVIGLLLGHRLRLPPDELRELTLGCILHDIGKLYIEEAILEKPSPLTAEEFEAVQQHPRMGFELIRRLPVNSILPAHVAYQHHERQDGTGYPRGLVGTNRGVRRADDRLDSRRMLLIAEIAAVADAYSVMASSRPYRPALALEQVRVTLARAAGVHLNRELVNLLLGCLPPYPVSQWVEVTGGDYAGWRGQVVEVDATAICRPVVRLLLDNDLEEVASQPELDLRRKPGVELVSLQPGDDPRTRTPVGATGHPAQRRPVPAV